MNKRERHQLITEIIDAEKIFTQKDIQDRLEAKGVVVTQTTLSRDLREIGLIKTHDQGKSYYTLPKSHESVDFIDVLATYIRKVERASFILVLHTRLGEAGVTSNVIDAAQPQQVLGTVAGADTVVVICRDEACAQDIETALLKAKGER